MPDRPRAEIRHPASVSPGFRRPDRPVYRRVINVPLPGWLLAAFRQQSARFSITPPAAMRHLAHSLLEHPHPDLVVQRLPPLPRRGQNAPRVKVQCYPRLVTDLDRLALRNGIGKAPVLGRLAMQWVNLGTAHPDHVAASVVDVSG